MKAFMESQKDPPVFMQSNNAGVQRVLDSDGQYAFLMESNSIQYQTERNCDLIQVGKLLDSKGYGIAFTPGKTWLCYMVISESMLLMIFVLFLASLFLDTFLILISFLRISPYFLCTLFHSFIL